MPTVGAAVGFREVDPRRPHDRARHRREDDLEDRSALCGGRENPLERIQVLPPSALAKAPVDDIPTMTWSRSWGSNATRWTMGKNGSSLGGLVPISFQLCPPSVDRQTTPYRSPNASWSGSAASTAKPRIALTAAGSGKSSTTSPAITERCGENVQA